MNACANGSDLGHLVLVVRGGDGAVSANGEGGDLERSVPSGEGKDRAEQVRRAGAEKLAVRAAATQDKAQFLDDDPGNPSLDLLRGHVGADLDVVVIEADADGGA